MNLKHCVFLTFAFILCAGICGFTFWLGFPGYIIDLDTFRVLDFDTSNYAPIALKMSGIILMVKL